MSMFSTTAEKTMHTVRWALASAWILLIISLLYDPISPRWITREHPLWAKAGGVGECIKVQGVCLEPEAFYLAAPIFWGLVVPGSVFILLFFGHELWRRICPLSFLSQIPRALGWQRRIKRVSPNGNTRYETARVAKDSWLAKNYLYLQFSWFFVGLCCRILFINADRLALAIWFLFTIAAAITVGYCYGGKTWCNYFCPMAPVQRIYAEPGGLTTSSAHLSDRKITQSMCREVDARGQEKSACVACQSPCIDIDAERTYWDGIQSNDRRLLYYGYVGLVVGYFIYYYLYSGNWAYYLSGIWAFETDQLGTLLNPGFYIAGRAIAIPKLLAVPLTLGGSTLIGLFLGSHLEKWAKARYAKVLGADQVQHRIFTLCTFLIFNFFFIFAGRSWIGLLPAQLQYCVDGLLFVISAIWLYRVLRRSPERYIREGLAGRLRKQLSKLQLNVSSFLEGRSLDDLDPDEVYVLAKILPGFNQDKRQEAYKNVLRGTLEDGYVNTVSSLEVLQQMRFELGISEDEHRTVLVQLGIEDPELLNPKRQRTLESSMRLEAYRKSLERFIVLQQKQSLEDLLQQDPSSVRQLRQEYCITYQEEEEILRGLDDKKGIWPRAQHLLQQLDVLIKRYCALNQPILQEEYLSLNLLRNGIRQKKRLLIRGLLEIIEMLGQSDSSRQAIYLRIVHDLSRLGPTTLQQVLSNPRSQWESRLNATLLNFLRQIDNDGSACSLELEVEAIISHLEALLLETNPIVQSVSLYILNRLDPEKTQKRLQNLHQSPYDLHPLVQGTVEVIANHPGAKLELQAFQCLEKLVYLANTDFFSEVHSATMIELATFAEFRSYQSQDVILDANAPCSHLLIVVAGIVQIYQPSENSQNAVSSIYPGQLLDELEVLTRTASSGKITAQSTPTRILAIPVDAFDELLERDHGFSRHVLEWECQRLRQLAEV